MSGYNEIYLQPNYFGDPLPELLRYFESLDLNQTVLDVGCGQGRNAIPLAKMGFTITGIDLSETCIIQLNGSAKEQNLKVRGLVNDIYQWDRYSEFNIVLLDSMFHFGKQEKIQEMELIKRIFQTIKVGSRCVVSIQDSGTKVATLIRCVPHNMIKELDQASIYRFKDPNSNHQSDSNYRILAFRKVKN